MTTGETTREQTPTRFSLRFTARDLVSVAIFAVIFIVVSYAIGMLGIISPPVWLILVPVSVLVNGITFIPALLDREAYFTGPSWEGMGAEYVGVAEQLITVPLLGLLALSILVAGFLGGLLGSSILRKHFVRAGLA